MSSRISLLAMTVFALVSFVACGGGSIGNRQLNTTYTIGGTVSGIPTGDSVILADNGTDLLTVGANGSFSFKKQIASGSAYAVTVQTPPPGEQCSVANGSGTASADVKNVSVTCSAVTFTIGGTVSGLSTGASVVLSDNASDTLTVLANGAFTFAKAIASGSSYSVSVQTQPTGETCTVTNGSGTATANVTNVNVACTATTTTYTIGGTVSGLAASTSVVLQDNGGDNLTVSATGSFTFATPIAAGTTYNVTVLTNPSGQICTVTNGTGTANANVTNVQVTCSANTYTIGGTLSGLSGGSVVLQDNGGDNLTLGTNGTFTFATALAAGSSYNVTVLTQPAGQNCVITNGTGTANANVTTVGVACAPVVITYTIGGTLSGLASGASVVLQDNGGDNLTLSANAPFTFATAVAAGTNYSVTVLTQPTGQACTVANGTGTANANVTNIAVTCVSQYTIGGAVTGLTPGGNLVLADNGAYDTLTILQDGAFTFPRTIAAGSTYAVTVTTQPTGQTCTVTNGNGTATANVTNVNVTCAATTYTIGGTLSGLTGGSVTLADNGAFDSLTLSANAPFTFAKSVTAGSAYAVTVTTQPSGQTCTVTNGTGTATANVTNVQVTCAATQSYTITVDVSGFSSTGSLIVSDNIGPNLTFTGVGNQAFTDTYLSGATYAVSIVQQPTGQTCSLSNNSSGTINANVTVTATCAANGNTFTIGGTIYDLSTNPTTSGVTLEYNNANGQTFTQNGTFTFTNPIASGATYTVTVQTQPGSPAQNCTVTNGTGTATANVTNVQVVCISEWTWVAGNDVVAVGGIYSTSKGTPYPGTRYGTQNWIDASGNFWAFGGLGYDINGPTVQQTTGGSNESILSDLWEYNSSSGWSFQGGDNLTGQCFDYPTSPGTAGSPSARSNAVSWMDSSGNLWMFGGYVAFNVPAFCPSAAAFNDLWEYTGGQWIWQGGGTTPFAPGVYTGSGQIPGARYWATSAVDPATGKLWMFGGYGFDVNDSFGYLNDLWVFDPTAMTWTFVAGSKTADPIGVYSGSGAIPGGRAGANAWIDSTGNFWLFGGDAFDSAGNAGPMNDLWKFPLSGTKWTFVGGSQTNGTGPVYGSQGIPSAGNLPGTREFATSWQTQSGDVWIFGGQRLGGALYTDLWKYSGGQWTWVAGSQSVNLLGAYPSTVGQTSPSIQPGSRLEGAGWVDSNGNLWLFGGYGLGSLPSGKSVHDGFDSLQDVWEFQP